MAKNEGIKIADLVGAGDFLGISGLRTDDRKPREFRHEARDVLDKYVGVINDPEVLKVIALYGRNFRSRISAVTKIGVAGDKASLTEIWSMKVPSHCEDYRISRAAMIVARKDLVIPD